MHCLMVAVRGGGAGTGGICHRDRDHGQMLARGDAHLARVDAWVESSLSWYGSPSPWPYGSVLWG